MSTQPPPSVNPIALRDLLLEEPNGFVRESAIRDLVDRGWPVHAILAELPGVSEQDVRNAAHAVAA